MQTRGGRARRKEREEQRESERDRGQGGRCTTTDRETGRQWTSTHQQTSPLSLSLSLLLSCSLSLLGDFGSTYCSQFMCTTSVLECRLNSQIMKRFPEKIEDTRRKGRDLHNNRIRDCHEHDMHHHGSPLFLSSSLSLSRLGCGFRSI